MHRAAAREGVSAPSPGLHDGAPHGPSIPPLHGGRDSLREATARELVTGDLTPRSGYSSTTGWYVLPARSRLIGGHDDIHPSVRSRSRLAFTGLADAGPNGNRRLRCPDGRGLVNHSTADFGPVHAGRSAMCSSCVTRSRACRDALYRIRVLARSQHLPFWCSETPETRSSTGRVRRLRPAAACIRPQRATRRKATKWPRVRAAGSEPNVGVRLDEAWADAGTVA